MSQTAIITGASTGIGKCLAIQLADIGYKTILVARSKDNLDSVSKEIQKNGGECLGRFCNIKTSF